MATFPKFSLIPQSTLSTGEVDWMNPMPTNDELYSMGSYGNTSGNGIKIPQLGSPSGSSLEKAPAGGDWLDGFLGTTSKPGWGNFALSAGQGMFNAWMGMQQYGLAKDKLAESKRQYAANYEAQRTTTNSALEDRQRARVASNAGAYESVGSYMDKYSVKGLS